jgi:hypothetical protein
MPGSLNDILPDPISQEDEEILLDLIKRKMKGAAGLTVWLCTRWRSALVPRRARWSAT